MTANPACRHGIKDKPKQVLEIFRALCHGKTEPYAELCKLFDAQTHHGQDMSACSALLDKALAAIVVQFTRKNAAKLFTGRGGKLMYADQGREKQQRL